MESGERGQPRVHSKQELGEIWDRTLGGASRELGRDCVEQWLRPVRLDSVARELAVLSAPSSYMADFIERNYGLALLRHLRAEVPELRRVSVAVAGPSALCGRDRAPQPVLTPAPVAPVPQSGDEPLPSAPLDSRFTFDSFVVGKSNELAFSAARRVAESADGSFNPIFLYGGVGLGKTHLMHAIAWQLSRTRPDCKVIYLSAERFMYRFVQALRFKDTMTFKEQFRSVDVLMIDDVQFIAGKDSTQEEFFHTFNALIDQKKQIVISADRSPDRIDGLEDRIKSRLQWGLVVDIHPADYELRLGILQAKAETLSAADPTFRIDPKVLEFLAHRISSNVRVLEGALTRLYAHSTLHGGRLIDLDVAHECLSDLLRSHDRKVTLDEIKRKVSDHYRLRVSDMVSDRRARAVARPRQVAMYLAKMITSKSLPQIGDAFGKRDHTTVIHAVRRIEGLMDTDSQLADDVENLRRMLES